MSLPISSKSKKVSKKELVKEPVNESKDESKKDMLSSNKPSRFSVGFLSDFVEFIKKYGVIGLALGVIVGNSINALVKSLVDNLINPLLAKLVDAQSLASWTVWDIRVGQFTSDFINFILLMFVVYVSVRFLIQRFLTDDELQKLKMK